MKERKYPLGRDTPSQARSRLLLEIIIIVLSADGRNVETVTLTFRPRASRETLECPRDRDAPTFRFVSFLRLLSFFLFLFLFLSLYISISFSLSVCTH